jgi:hypothetical protein
VKLHSNHDDVHINTLEGFFSVFKRGLIGTYQHMDSKHLERYLTEFDFRFNRRAKLGIDDLSREKIALEGAKVSGSPTKQLGVKSIGANASPVS